MILLSIEFQGSFITTISQDLRICLIEKVAKGMSCRRAAAHFEVSPSSAIRFTHQYKTERSVALKVRGPHKRRLDPYGENLLSWIEKAPETTNIKVKVCKLTAFENVSSVGVELEKNF